jgi:putative hydrolase of the HAD superfamily
VCETHNLPLYGYGAKGFTLSMIETAVELCGADLKPTLVADILAAGRSLLAHPVEPFDGIAQTLEDLADRGRLVLVTKGDLLHQGAKLAASGLGDRFAGVDIVSDKTADTFTRLFKRYAVQSAEAVMAGDSMRSDVRPALEAGGWRLEAGAWAAYVPQDGAWAHEHATPPEDSDCFATLGSLAELPALIDRINRG